MPHLFRRFVVLSALLAVGISPGPAWAQAVYGSIFGTVTDPTGGVVPNAKVTITDQEKNTKFETTTNADGNFSRTQLIPGTYRVEVEAAGFRKATISDVRVSADVAGRVDFKLEVGNVAETVEVTAAAPLLTSDRAEVSTMFTSHQLTELPSFSRNFQSYELLIPGAQKLGWQHASSENPQGSLQIEVNGQHFSGTGFQLDGTDNQDPILGIIVINPNLDAVTETKMTTQNYDAEFGLAIAGIMTAQTKSGTNSFHGTGFEYNRDNTPGFTTFARNPFNSAENKQTPPVKWNQFGGTFGGPIKKDKLFFFGDYQGTRRRTGSSVNTQVPTNKARNGDFSEYLEPIAGAGQVQTTTGQTITFQRNMVFDPLTGNPNTGVGRQAFPNNTIPPSRISQQAAALLKFLPPPNATDIFGSPFRRNFSGVGSENFDTNQWDTREDWYLSEKTQMFGRYSYAGFEKFAPGAFGLLPGGAALDTINFAGTSKVRNQSLAAGLNYTFSPTLLSEFRFGFMRYRVNVLPNGLGTSPAKDAGIPGLNLDNFFTSGMPAFFINGDGGFNFGYSLGTNQCNCPLQQEEQQFQWVNNNTKIRGNHNFKFGADLRYAMNLRVPSDSHRAGELSFGNGYTGYAASAGAGASGGLGLATFMLGEATSFARYVSPFTDAAERQKRFFWYVQDTWRLTNKLTVNYGLRWEQVFPEKVNGPGKGGQLDLRDGNITVFGVGKVSDHGIQDMNWKSFAPRLGVAYQLAPKTVIRAGYGWSYSIGTFGSIFGHNVTQNLPVLAIQRDSAPNAFSGVFTLAEGPKLPPFPQPNAEGRFPLPNGVGGKARPMTLVMPRVMAYNFTVQHQLTPTLAFSAGYVGNTGRHTFNGDGPNFNVNEAAFVPGVADANVRKPFFARYGWTQGIDFYCNCATTQYDSLQITATKRMSGGYSLQGSYTYSRGVQDDGDSFTFLYNRPLGRGVNGFDRKHMISVAQTWDVPVGRGRYVNIQGPLDWVAGGWGFSGITTIYSGLPFTPGFDNPDPSRFIRPNAGPAGRLDRGSGSPYAPSKGRDQWTAKGLGGPFLVPANNTFGNYGRNTLRGPSFFQQDLSMMKTFKPTERVGIEVRGEAYNVFNHTNLGMPNSNVTAGDAGRISSLAFSGGDNAAGLMRRLQFGVHVSF